MDEIEITPLTGPFDARVVLPGSKSITNRAMLLAALAQGRSVIESALFSDDTRYMADALRALGFTVEIEAPRPAGSLSAAVAESSRRWRGVLRRRRRHRDAISVPFLTLGERRFVSTAISGCASARSVRNSTRCSGSARGCTASATTTARR